MRLGVVPFFMLLICLVMGTAVLGSGYVYARQFLFLEESCQDALLEGYAESLGELSVLAFEKGLDGGEDGEVLVTDFSGEAESKYSKLSWEESGRLLNEGAAPEWIGELPKNLMREYLNRYVTTGASEFRYDNFEAFRAGEVKQALCLRVRYFPKQHLFLGFGGPFEAMSVRLNAAKGLAYERARVETLVLGGGLLLFLTAAIITGYCFFSRAVRGPLRALAAGEVETNAVKGFAQEVAQVGVGMSALKGQILGLQESEKQGRERLAKVTEELEHLRSDFAHRVGATELELRGSYDHALSLERKGLYERVAMALKGEDDLVKRLQGILEGEAMGADKAEEIELKVFLPALAREYAEASSHTAPEVNAQCGAKVELVKEDLRGVLLELLSNAYLHGGGMQAVYLNCAQAEGRIEISVSDSGAGIGEGERGLLFQPFYSTLPGHVGLGLARARALCIRMGCDLQVYAEAGKGFVAVVGIGEDAVARQAGRE